MRRCHPHKAMPACQLSNDGKHSSPRYILAKSVKRTSSADHADAEKDHKADVNVGNARESPKTQGQCRGWPGPVPYVQWGPGAAGAAGLWGCHGTVSTCKTRPVGRTSAVCVLLQSPRVSYFSLKESVWPPHRRDTDQSLLNATRSRPLQNAETAGQSAAPRAWAVPSATLFRPANRTALTPPKNPGPRGNAREVTKALKCPQKDGV